MSCAARSASASVDDDGDLDLRSRDQLDVDAAFSEAIEEPRGDAGMRSHPDPDHTELGDAGFRDQARRLNFLDERREQFCRGAADRSRES